jgi:hypothetical protein
MFSNSTSTWIAPRANERLDRLTQTVTRRLWRQHWWRSKCLSCTVLALPGDPNCPHVERHPRHHSSRHLPALSQNSAGYGGGVSCAARGRLFSALCQRHRGRRRAAPDHRYSLQCPLRVRHLRHLRSIYRGRERDLQGVGSSAGPRAFSGRLKVSACESILQTVRAYARRVADSEWRELARGDPTDKSDRLFAEIVSTVAAIRPEDEDERTVYGRLLEIANQASVHRGERLSLSVKRMPRTLFVLLNPHGCGDRFSPLSLSLPERAAGRGGAGDHYHAAVLNPLPNY